MKLVSLLSAWFALWAPTCALASPEELAQLDTCVSRVRAEVDWCRRYIPMEFFSMDRRLHQMSFGVEALQDNLSLLRRRQSEGGLQSHNQHLVANAVEGCRVFRENFQARLRLFLALGVCLLSLMAALTLRALYFMVPPRNAIAKKTSDDKSADLSPGTPSDRAGHDRRP